MRFAQRTDHFSLLCTPYASASTNLSTARFRLNDRWKRFHAKLHYESKMAEDDYKHRAHRQRRQTTSETLPHHTTLLHASKLVSDALKTSQSSLTKINILEDVTDLPSSSQTPKSRTLCQCSQSVTQAVYCNDLASKVNDTSTSLILAI